MSAVVQPLVAPKRGAAERRLGIDRQPVPSGRQHIGTARRVVADLTAEHFLEQITGGVVHCPNHRQVALMVGAETVSAKTLVQDGFHTPFALDPFDRVVEEVLVKRDPGMSVPPRGVQHDLGGQKRGSRALFHSGTHPNEF